MLRCVSSDFQNEMLVGVFGIKPLFLKAADPCESVARTTGPSYMADEPPLAWYDLAQIVLSGRRTWQNPFNTPLLWKIHVHTNEYNQSLADWVIR